MPVSPGNGVRLLIVYKKSQLELYQEHQPETLRRLAAHEPAVWDRFVLAHETHAATIRAVEQAIAERPAVHARYVYRADHESAAGSDLVVSVGGDGTLLDVSHNILRCPLLGVNSSPDLSVGNFCAATADDFGATLDGWLAGEIGETPLSRLQVVINGVAVDTPILNEALFAHQVPAAMSRYVLSIGDIEEEHKSSGIWISTAAGSTAAIRSAGGQVMPVEDARLQYVVREPYVWPGKTYRLLGGTFDPPLGILTKMRTAAVYLDGHRHSFELTVGDRVELHRHPAPLRLVGFSHRIAEEHPS